ncbi:MAG: hypothetical protein IT204_21545 [Fimbriimonadaceae bacterium]|nr:hypothetical protein [Fimbriimonadaceae bacterium]
MLTDRLRGIPRPMQATGPELLWEWTPGLGDGPVSPWGGPSRQPTNPINWIPNTGVPTEAFTFELWLRPRTALRSEDMPIVLTSCNVRGPAWIFELTRHLRPQLRWLDTQGHAQVQTGDALVDLLEPAQWLHLGIAHIGAGADPADPTSAYARWDIYLTPAGEAWPRLVLHVAGERAVMPGAAGCVKLMPGPFSYAQAACWSNAKLPNEFDTLGQEAPDDVSFDADFSGGSLRAPVALGPRRVVVGCNPGLSGANHWFASRVKLADPADRQPLELTLLAAPHGQGNLNCLFRTVDGQTWERLPGGWFQSDRHLSSHGFLRVEVPADAPEFTVAAAPHYGLPQVEQLLSDLGEHPWVTPLALGESVRGRAIRGLRITHDETPGEAKDLVVMIAGQHSPMEQATGFVVDALARRLVADETYAAFLAAHEVHLVPLVNADSAHLGQSGLTQHRLNSNRYWLGREIAETRGIRRHLAALAARQGRVRLALDLHGGGLWPNHTSLYLGQRRAAAVCPPGWDVQVKRWMAVLEQHTGIAQADAQESREGLNHFSAAAAVKFGWPAVTLEFSLATWRDLDGTVRPVTQDSLRLIGERLADALVAYCKD